MAKPNTAVKAVPDSDDEVPEDLNAAVVTLEWKDQTFTLPKRRGRWPTRAAREFARENYLEAIIALIGEEAYQRLEGALPGRRRYERIRRLCRRNDQPRVHRVIQHDTAIP